MAIPNLKKRIREMNGGRSLDDQFAGRSPSDTKRELWSRGFYTELNDALKQKGVGGLNSSYYTEPEYFKNDVKRLVNGHPGSAKQIVDKMREEASKNTLEDFKVNFVRTVKHTTTKDGKETTKYDITSPAYSAGSAPEDIYKTPEDVRNLVNDVGISDLAAEFTTDTVMDEIRNAVDESPDRYRAGDSRAYKDFRGTIIGKVAELDANEPGLAEPGEKYSKDFLDKSKVLSAENQKVIDESKKKTADDAKWAQDAAKKLGVKVDLDMSNTGYKRKSLEEIRAEVDRQSEERRAKWRAEHPVPPAPQQTASDNVQQTASDNVQQTAFGNVQQAASASNANQDVFNKDSTQAASKAGRSSRRAVLKTTHDLDYLLSEFPREDSLDDLLQED